VNSVESWSVERIERGFFSIKKGPSHGDLVRVPSYSFLKAAEKVDKCETKKNKLNSRLKACLVVVGNIMERSKDYSIDQHEYLRLESREKVL
jgi:hypothetical protein